MIEYSVLPNNTYKTVKFYSLNEDLLAESYDSNDQLLCSYKLNDESCDFYSDRDSGRKKYWSENLTNDYEIDSSDSYDKTLCFYAEIENKLKEWYYSFASSDDMFSFLSGFSSESFSDSLKNAIKVSPEDWRPVSCLNKDHNFLCSVEKNLETNEFTVSVYLSEKPVDN